MGPAMPHRHESMHLNKRQVLHRDDPAAVPVCMTAGGRLGWCAGRSWVHRVAGVWPVSIDARVVIASFSCTSVNHCCILSLNSTCIDAIPEKSTDHALKNDRTRLRSGLEFRLQ